MNRGGAVRTRCNWIPVNLWLYGQSQRHICVQIVWGVRFPVLIWLEAVHYFVVWRMTFVCTQGLLYYARLSCICRDVVHNINDKQLALYHRQPYEQYRRYYGACSLQRVFGTGSSSQCHCYIGQAPAENVPFLVDMYDKNRDKCVPGDEWNGGQYLCGHWRQ